MPLKLPDRLPAIDILKKENIFVMDNTRASGQDIRPLRIAILNLMPIKITTETDFIRILSNTPLQVEIEFMKIKSHTSKNTPIEHMMMFYKDFEQMRNEKYDGLIVTGAPLEQMDFEQVKYWDELREVFDWAYHNVQEDSTVNSTCPTAGMPKCIRRTLRRCRNCKSFQRVRRREYMPSWQETGVSFSSQVTANMLRSRLTESTSATWLSTCQSTFRRTIMRITTRKRIRS